MKKYLKLFFITLPNFPIVIILSIYILFKIFKYTGFIELNVSRNDLSPELKKYIKQMYPKHLTYAIATLFWLSIALEIIRSNSFFN